MGWKMLPGRTGADSIKKIASSFFRRRDGTFAIQLSLLFVPLVVSVGLVVDYTRASSARSTVQNAADTAVLAVAAMMTGATNPGEIEGGIDAILDNFLDSNGNPLPLARKGPATLNEDQSELCINVTAEIDTTFIRIANIETVPVSAVSCASPQMERKLEIALVLDVSSSMIEESRFTPMQTAVSNFLDVFSSDNTLRENSRIAIVPFSSRVNFGMGKAGWLKAHGGNPAVPDRWQNPANHYNSNHQLHWWIDGVTPMMQHTTNQNYYWMGCVEPRADVDMHDTNAIGPHGLTDAAPQTAKFVAMDSNRIPVGSHAGKITGESFCPPPIVPLTSNFTTLNNANGKMTSQGSTRLDTGIVAGWYALSPAWAAAWGAAAAPAAYSPNVRKVVVFMTDGAMNTQYRPDSDNPRHIDWLCMKDRTTGCHSFANQKFVQTCTAMKAQGIEIYGVSYDKDSDLLNVKACASGEEHFHVANKNVGSSSHIAVIYEQIAKSIARKVTRLTR